MDLERLESLNSNDLARAAGEMVPRRRGRTGEESAAAGESLPYDPGIMSDSNTKTTSFVPADQQPIKRTIGKRVTPPPGELPSLEARAAMTANAQFRTRAPKGIFFYKNHDEMIRDRERWTIEAVIARQTERA